MAPAFILSAPPRFPGMPSIHSNPVRPAVRATAASCLSRIPTPAVISFPSTAQAVKQPRARWATTPGKPPSLTRRLEPRPMTMKGIPSSWQKRTNSANPSSVSGSAQKRAGPPTLMVVWRERGSASLMTPSPIALRRRSRSPSSPASQAPASWMFPAPRVMIRSPSRATEAAA